MKNQRGYTTLIIMLAATAVFIVVGFFILRKNSTTPEVVSDDQTKTENITPPAEEPKAETPVDTTIVGWNTYTNAKYGYSLQYPPNLKVGSISGNSVLGTFDAPVKGFDVGPLVFISLTGSLRKSGADYFNSTYETAVNPPEQIEGGPGVECKVDKIVNSNAVVKSVSCTGEGGAAKYALIAGTDYDIFVDGYSKGFDESDNGDFKATDDYVKILGTFKFTVKASSTESTLAQNDPTKETTPLAVQSYSITADDSGANPGSISVPKGTIVNLTINVASQNVYQGELSFKSSVVNSGAIAPGASKTIAFTVNNSFEFTPYWPQGLVEKPYKISIIAE